MKDKFLIGELANIFDITTDTLRYYDKIGLLKPEYDKSNNYRYYSIEKFFILSRILFLRNLDIPVKDIKYYFENPNTMELLRLLDKEEVLIDQKISRLMNLKRKIQNKKQLIEEANKYIDDIRVEYIPKRYGVFIDIENNQNKYELKRSFKQYEAAFKMSSWLVEGHVYTAVTKADTQTPRIGRFNYCDELIPNSDGIFTG